MLTDSALAAIVGGVWVVEITVLVSVPYQSALPALTVAESAVMNPISVEPPAVQFVRADGRGRGGRSDPPCGGDCLAGVAGVVRLQGTQRTCAGRRWCGRDRERERADGRHRERRFAV
jgi:hypothetical protein